MSFRAFISADLAAPVAVRAFSESLRETRAHLNLVDLDTFHLTMKFLGDIPETAVEAIVAAVHAATAGEPPIDAQLRGAGAFPSLRRMTVVWVGVSDGGRLAGIATKLEDEMERGDFRREDRPFHAHATVARVKGGAHREALQKVLEAHVATDFGMQRIESIRLKRSVLSGRGPTYSDVAVAPLSG